MCTFGVLTLRAWIFQQDGEASASVRGAMVVASKSFESLQAAMEAAETEEEFLRLWLVWRGVEASEIENILARREIRSVNDSKGIANGGSVVNEKSSAATFGGRGGSATSAPSAPMMWVDANGTVPGSHATLQLAWEAAQDGDVIGVMPGTYAGFSIYGGYHPKSVWFVAQTGPGEEPPVITSSVNIYDYENVLLAFEGLVFRPQGADLAVTAIYGDMLFINCLFDGKGQAENHGYWYPLFGVSCSSISLIHCTLVANEDIVSAYYVDLFVKNSILWSRSVHGGVHGCQMDVENSIVKGGQGGTGADPHLTWDGWLRADSEAARGMAEAGWAEVDIHGVARDASAPDMGCSEFNAGRLPPLLQVYMEAVNPHSTGVTPVPTMTVGANEIYKTLQAAWDAAGDGEIIEVKSGTYEGLYVNGGFKNVLFLATTEPGQVPPVITDNVYVHNNGGVVMFEGIVFRPQGQYSEVYTVNARVIFLNCLFDDKKPEYYYGFGYPMFDAYFSDISLIHCTLVGNEKTVSANDSNFFIKNSIVWNRGQNAAMSHYYGEVTAEDSIIKGWQGGGLNVSTADPLLTPEGRLSKGSIAAIGKADAGWARVDILGTPRSLVLMPTIGCVELKLPDCWEMLHFGYVGVDPYALAPSGNGSTILENWLAGTNPNDYYDHPNGRIISRLAIAGGNHQTSEPNEFLPQPLTVLVGDKQTGQPLVNAPVKFNVTQGGGKLAFAPSLGQGQFESVEVRTNEYGKASIHYLQPAGEGVVSKIKVSAPYAKPAVFTATAVTIAAPVVGIVGGNQTLVWPEKEATLEATAVDLGGLPLTTTWSVVSGTGTVEFEDAQGLATAAKFDYPGVYVLEFTASNGSKSASVQTTVTVDPGSEPAVRFISPADGTVVEIGETITFAVEASSPDSPIAQVTLYRDGEVVASYTKGLDGTITIPRSESLSDTYTYTAVATDTNGNTSSASTSATSRNTSGSEEVESEIAVAVLMDNSTPSKSGLVPTVPMLVLVGTTSFKVLPGVVQEEKVMLKKWNNHSIVVNSEGQPWPRCAEYDPGTGKGCGEITCFECEFTDENYLFRHAIGNVLLEGQFALDFTAGDGHWKVQNWGTIVGALWGPGASYSHPYHGGGVSYLSVNPIQSSIVREVPIGSGNYKAVNFRRQWLPVYVPSDGVGCGEPIIAGGTTAPNGALIYADIDMTLPPVSGRNRMALQLTNTQSEESVSAVLLQIPGNPLVYTDEEVETVVMLSAPFSPAAGTLQTSIRSHVYQSGTVPLMLTLPRTVPNEYSNYTITPTDIIPLDPHNSDQCVFYVEVSGQSLVNEQSVTVKLTSGDNELVLEAEPTPDNPTVFRTGKIALYSEEGSGSSSSSMSAPASLNSGMSMQSTAGTASTPMMATSGGGGVSTLVIAAAFKSKKKVKVEADGVGMGDRVAKVPAFIGKALKGASEVSASHLNTIEKLLNEDMGWGATKDQRVTCSKFLEALTKCYLLYFFTHGIPESGYFKCIDAWDDADPSDRKYITTADIKANVGTLSEGEKYLYDLVFINACRSAEARDGSGSYDFAAAFKAEAYIGWDDVQNTSVAGNAAIRFFTALSKGETVTRAVEAGNTNPGFASSAELIGSGEFKLKLK